MVRVGGGWVALDEFLLKNDPCRGKCFIHLFYLIFFLSIPLPSFYIYNIYNISVGIDEFEISPILNDFFFYRNN